MDRTPSVAQLSIAPVKAMALQLLTEAEIGPAGIAGDRRFALIDAAGRLVNGKRLGPLVTIVPTVSADGAHLVLRFPDGTIVEGAVVPGAPAEGLFFGRARAVRHLSGPFDAALSDWAGIALHLVELATPGSGVDRGDTSGAVSIASMAALSELAHAGGLDAPLDHRRFRMTIWVAGVPAWAEDGWLGRDVHVGEAVVRPAGNVGRCAVTTQDPDRGHPDVDTLRLLRDLRGDAPSTEPLPLGVWGMVVRPGRVRVGDPVRVAAVSD
jgi:hypothetical protein